jgi:hypothetical protein
MSLFSTFASEACKNLHSDHQPFNVPDNRCALILYGILETKKGPLFSDPSIKKQSYLLNHNFVIVNNFIIAGQLQHIHSRCSAGKANPFYLAK